ncbi:hypothetical protein NBRC116493_10320 [Aurantivibrio infirmus]
MKLSPEKLTKLRKDRGWSQEKLAAISGISERTIQRAEKDGSVSMDSKLAFATVFEVSPAELSQSDEAALRDEKSEYVIDWSGVIGLFILGLVTMTVVLLTATNGKWELASISIVWGLTVLVSIISHGARETYRLYDNTSWIVKYPNYVRGLNKFIAHAKMVINNTYIIGVSASLITSISLVIHSNLPQEDFQRYLAIISKPVIYAIIFSELWFRPYKRKMERMLRRQNE